MYSVCCGTVGVYPGGRFGFVDMPFFFLRANTRLTYPATTAEEAVAFALQLLGEHEDVPDVAFRDLSQERDGRSRPTFVIVGGLFGGE